MRNHNNDTIKTSETVFRKIFLSLYWKGCVREGVGDRTELQHIDPHSYGHNSVSFPFSWAAQPGVRGPLWWVLVFSTASYLQLIFSPTDWLPVFTRVIYPVIYPGSTPTFFLWASHITLIQLVLGQGYILIFLDRMHLLVTQVHFLFWQPGRVGCQYTTISFTEKIAIYTLNISFLVISSHAVKKWDHLNEIL